MWCFVNENSAKYNDTDFYLITDVLDNVSEIFLQNEILKHRYKFTDNSDVKIGLYISDNGIIEDLDFIESQDKENNAKTEDVDVVEDNKE